MFVGLKRSAFRPPTVYLCRIESAVGKKSTTSVSQKSKINQTQLLVCLLLTLFVTDYLRVIQILLFALVKKHSSVTFGIKTFLTEAKSTDIISALILPF